MKTNEDLVVCKTTICGKEYETYIKAKDWKEIAANIENKTGYERVKKDELYWYDDGAGGIGSEQEDEMAIDNELYMSANYYSSKEVAENNARADQLMRQLRRFAVEHRTNFNSSRKYYIYWDKICDDFGVAHSVTSFYRMGPVFDSVEATEMAIEEFKDELIWYFTEYKDSL